MNKTFWEKWQSDWNWIMHIAKQRNWNYSEVEIKTPVTIDDFSKLEAEIGIQYPKDFKSILTEYASAVHFHWYMDEDGVDGFKALFCGGSDGILWDFTFLRNMYDGYKGWIKTCFPNPDNDYDKVWHNKAPFLEVGNGDMIAFDISQPEGICPVVYLSHDGSDFHGSPLADNFIDFITRWSNIGCIGTEDWQLEVFYDFENKKLTNNSSIIEEWKEALTVKNNQ